MTFFKQPISFNVWDKKSRYNNESIPEYYNRIARALADNHSELYGLLYSHILSFGGRIMANVGTDKKNVTYSNCFVIPIESDSMTGIMEALTNSSLTMKAGGGVGYNFSVLRPKSSIILTSGAESSGVVSFMRIFDAACHSIKSGNDRRGAQMGMINIWHPDVEDVIYSKRDGSLSNFNISIGITDDFIKAVEDDEDWDLVFPDYEKSQDKYNEIWDGNLERWKKEGLPIKVYKTVKAKELYDKIIKANYDYAEPGVVFLDTVNKYNNLNYCEYIQATNPCGEQPLPKYGSCNLGSVNLANIVVNPFEDSAGINYNLLDKAVYHLVNGLDRVLDLNYYVLPEQGAETEMKRQIGIGVTGLGDMLAMLRVKYSSKEGVNIINEVMRTIANKSYFYSAMLAKEKGSFPLFEKDKFLKSPFVKKLDKEVREAIAEYGIRNSRLLSIAPTGTISIIMNNVSSGIEPIFNLEYIRKVRKDSGSEEFVEEKVKDYAYMLFQEKFGEEVEVPDYFETATKISIDGHLNMQAAVQRWCDASVSKTVNIPTDYPYEDFKKVYFKAYKLGLKGCTTYRPNNIVGSILVENKDSEKEDKDTGIDILFNNSNVIIKSMLEKEGGDIYRVVWKQGVTVKLIITVDDEGMPMEVFAKIPKNVGSIQPSEVDLIEKKAEWNTFLKLIKYAIDFGMPIEEILKQLRDVEYLENNTTISSLVIRYIYYKGVHQFYKIDSDKIYDVPEQILQRLNGDKYTGRYNEKIYLKRKSSWDGICKLVSVLLRADVPLKDVVNILDKNALNMFTIPSLISKKLKEYLYNVDIEELREMYKEGLKMEVGEICPDCGEPALIFEQGCNKCLNCGFSKCN
jgi:ribonucleoside-diphosphate reductase alpha chain